MKHIMLDLETYGTKPGAVIRQIAMVQFDIETGETGKFVDLYPDTYTQNKQGLSIETECVKWWKEHALEAHMRLKDNPEIHYDVSRLVIGFLSYGFNCLWANDPSFDCVLLRAYLEALGYDYPTHLYKKERSCRTISWLGLDKNAPEIPFVGIKHNALDDCYHQIKWVCTAYARLNKL